jgi:catechol 2,3-dioxygenase-like lactoylglutathione lyase family enzyme
MTPVTPPSPATVPAAPPTIGLFEFVLEVADLAASERFYAEHLGLPVVERWGDERAAVWLSIGREGTLGLWPVSTGGDQAIHGGRGGAHVHFALRVPSGTLSAMQARLEALGYAVEDGWTFGPGDHAVYLDDPDGNVVELTERVTLWGGGPASEPSDPSEPMENVDA